MNCVCVCVCVCRVVMQTHERFFQISQRMEQLSCSMIFGMERNMISLGNILSFFPPVVVLASAGENQAQNVVTGHAKCSKSVAHFHHKSCITTNMNLCSKFRFDVSLFIVVRKTSPRAFSQSKPLPQSRTAFTRLLWRTGLSRWHRKPRI